MAEGDGTIAMKFLERLFEGEIDVVNDTLSMRLMAAGHTPTTFDEDWADVSAEEYSDASYAAGGQTLGSKTLGFDSGTEVLTFDCADVLYASLDGGTPSYSWLVDNTHSSLPLLAFWELGRAANGGNYTLTVNASGLITAQQTP